ncbi:SGNH/GDSL hydrolase family protein [Streptomyces pseudovenezuelae]|uniref:Lysophospholipase L1-like esterase n=1 Tax=Streptomyces pseudovenezuelae TaxID=67350 RepID=A0ABT6LZ76_9ACTN|nr:SGNH/GDSL hydrolase family protein [Streptomyces pseudovenezuelae]MDH6221611.1 lysophospholipase L1-like esterase [Streptomyces pseudovenezuelae]
MTHLRVVLIGILLSVVALTAAVAETHMDSDTAGHSDLQGPYVALGDSYTSGPRIPAQSGKPAGCDRSDHNYPALVTAQLKLKPGMFRDMSCSGATTVDFTSSQSTDNGRNPAQLSALSSRTRLVTVGIGGNDIGFSSMLTRCLTMGTAYKIIIRSKDVSVDAPCRDRYVKDGTDSTQQRMTALGTALSDLMKEIRQRAPKAHIYIVGYPAILPPGGTGCGRRLPLAPGDIAYLREREEQLNKALRQQARTADATYVDTYTESRKHSACSARDTRWVEPLIPSNPAAPVHPNARGQRAITQIVLRAMRAAQ